jgi:uncharacterized protein
MKINFEAIWVEVVGQLALGPDTIHGPDHWRRVERNGLYLAAHSGARVDVVRLFAVLHDARRLDEGADPEHGRRAAAYARELRGWLFELDDAGFELLFQACHGHVDVKQTDEQTIGTCLDADRLDLRRVYIPPDPRFLSTDAARAIARSRQFHLIDSVEPTSP